jgi:hypothetical protein|tara:strand:- start:4086 stop:4493 length:408 start_codon:yes stop_codon:yes gene_type:complete
VSTYEKLLVGRQVKDLVLNVTSEDGELIEIPIKLRGLPWSLKNQKISLAVTWGENGQTSFDGDFYIRECLKWMVVEAPWGETTDSFLAQCGPELGTALENLVPKAFVDTSTVTTDEVKKELIESSEEQQPLLTQE